MKPPRLPVCVEPLRFPARPENRPSLPHIGYRIGRYSDIREALLRSLDVDPTLAAWTHRQADDPGIALLEGAAILGDILTFYQELYANEAFLRTATWRESVNDLVRLVGYRLAPGTGGNATFVLDLRGDRKVTVPAGFPIKAEVAGIDPAPEFETDEAVDAYPWLGQFNLHAPTTAAPAGQGQKQLRLLTAPASLGTGFELQAGDRLLVGTGTATAFDEPTEIAVIDSVRQHLGQTLVTLKNPLQQIPAGTAQVMAVRLGRTFHHFGYNAPRQVISIGDDGKVVTPVPTLDYLRWFGRGSTTNRHGRPSMGAGRGGGDAAGTSDTIDPELEEKDYLLDATVDDLSPGSTIVAQFFVSAASGTDESRLPDRYLGARARARPAQGTAQTSLRTLTAARGATMTWGSLSGPSTLLALDSGIVSGGNARRSVDIRQIRLHETTSPLLTFDGGAVDVPGTGNTLHFFGTPEQASSLAERRLLIVFPPGRQPLSIKATAVDATLASPGQPALIPVTLDQNVDHADFAGEKPTALVHGNLLAATEGRTQAEAILGNGDQQQVFQTFKVPKAPLTYFTSASAVPPHVPELQIHVNDCLWDHVPSFHDRGPEERIYIVRQDAAGDSWVQFGDGISGARIPSGVKNVRARYRKGLGTSGPLKPDTGPTAGARLDNLRALKLPLPVVNGSPPESRDKARLAAPGTVQSLGRIVSLQDYETEALTIGNVAKARASWELRSGIPTVVVAVLMADGSEAEITQDKGVADTVRRFDQLRGAFRHPVAVEVGLFEYVYLALTVSIDPRALKEVVARAIKEALGLTGQEDSGVNGEAGLFSVGRRSFAEDEYASRVEGVVQNVPGVLWAQVSGFGSLGPSSEPGPPVQLPPSPWPPSDRIACGAHHILRLYSRADERFALTFAGSGSPHV